MKASAISQLRNFLLSKMRMSHIYQPLMLRTILGKGGEASVREMAARHVGALERNISFRPFAERAGREAQRNDVGATVPLFYL